MRTWWPVLHVIGAGTWLGANITQAVATPGFVKAGGVTAARWWETTVAMGRVLYPPAAVAILVSGIFLVLTSNGGYRFSDLFVTIGFAMVVVGGVLGSTVFGPAGKQAAERREAGDAAAAVSVERRLRRVGLIDTVLLLVTITAMVWRLGV